MFVASSLTFGILLLFRASLAQSAPHMYPDVDEDEEAIIDRLASLAAAVGPETLSRQMFSNYDLPQLGGYLGDVNGDMMTKDALASLPRQFAYRPDDARFYLPAEQFTNYYPQEKAETFRGEKETVGNSYSSHNQGERQPQTDESSNDVTFSKIPPQDLIFMKKNQPGEEPIHPVHNIIADPSNLVSSGHSVEKPFQSLYPVEPEQPFSYSDIYYIGIVAGCSAAAVIGLVGAGICWYRIHQRVKAAAEVDYPAYGVTGPSKDVSPSGGDRKLAQSAHMYHYQHQKQQMAALQKGALQGDRQGSGGSDVDESDDDNEDDNDYTVYECPGLAPAGEMEVKNPLFQDEPTPATPQQMKPEEEK